MSVTGLWTITTSKFRSGRFQMEPFTRLPDMLVIGKPLPELKVQVLVQCKVMMPLELSKEVTLELSPQRLVHLPLEISE